MSERSEFQNITGHTIYLHGPKGEKVEFTKFARKVLDPWFRKFVPRYLREVRSAVQTQPAAKPTPVVRQVPTTRPVVAQHIRHSTNRKMTVVSAERKLVPQKHYVGERHTRKIVGQFSNNCAQATEHLHQLINKTTISISNDIGVGILSYNRLDCLKRCVESIRKHTDLTKTTIFISDESTDQSVKDYLNTINDMVVITNGRIGIAGNSNRLLRCLSRFRNKILLNDDVEIMARGWDSYYFNAIERTGIQHFCYRQPGVYGAHSHEGSMSDIAGIRIRTITEKPQGAVMAFNHKAFSKVGYFDESFGPYGMEHVDWSNRVSLSGIQLAGFHDVVGSENYFKIHNESTSTPERSEWLAAARRKYESVRHDKSRLYIHPSSQSKVPSIGYVIPFRGLDRKDCVRTVLQNIKAQKFPEVDIVMVEQDGQTLYNLPEFESVKYALSQNRTSGQPFTKAQAFNLGVSRLSASKVILHDADMMVYDVYAGQINELLDRYDGVHIGANVLYINQPSTDVVNRTGRLATDINAEKTVKYYEGGSLACNVKTYIDIGGFNEDFIGYGNEDTEFFARLSTTRFFNERSIDLVHLWHGRNEGWTQHHARNKQIEEDLKQRNMDERKNKLRSELAQRYQLTR
jgi:GT2 family glycosyltransferase